MLKNILKFSIAIFLVLHICACEGNIQNTNIASLFKALAPEHNVSPSYSLNPIESDTEDAFEVIISDEAAAYALQVIAEFEAQTPAPDGTTASMIEYSEKYLELWQTKIKELIAEDDALTKEFQEFSTELDTMLSEYADEFRESSDAPYGSEVSYMLTWKRAELLCEWFCKHYSK